MFDVRVGAKKAEHQRIDAFKPWCWRRLWTARRSNQSILKETNPEYSLEGLMLKWKLQYFGHLMWRADSFEKTLMLGKIEGSRRRGRQRISGWMASLTQWTWVWVNSGSWWWTGRPGVLQSMGSQRVGYDWETELNWTEWFSYSIGFSSKEALRRVILCENSKGVSLVPMTAQRHFENGLWQKKWTKFLSLSLWMVTELALSLSIDLPPL